MIRFTIALLALALAAPALAAGPNECPPGPPGPAGPPGEVGPQGPPGDPGEGVFCAPLTHWYSCKRGKTVPATEADKKVHLCYEDLITGELSRFTKTGKNTFDAVERDARVRNLSERLCE